MIKPPFPVRLLALLVQAALVPAAAYAANPVLIKDLNTSVPHQASGMSTAFAPTALDFPMAQAGGVAYFAGTDPHHGTEPWRTDGTAAGTYLLKDLNPSGNSFPSAFVASGSSVYFIASDGSDGPQLWKTDGTSAGTVLVHTFPGNVGMQVLRAAGGLVFFVATEHASGTTVNRLWRSDGTDAGTFQVFTFPSFPIFQPVTSNGRVFFIVPTGTTGVVPPAEMYVSDGSVAGTMSLGPAGVAQPAEMDGFVYYAAADGTTGAELWRTDGTLAGTSRVADINPGFLSSNPTGLTKVGSTLFFFASDGVHGQELWKTDGTAAGTAMVKDMVPGPGSPSVNTNTMWQSQGLLYFDVFQPTTGQELWRSDGTDAGTFMVSDIDPGPLGSSPAEIVDMGTYTAFKANDGAHGTELWRTNGASGNATMVADIMTAIGGSGSDPSNLTNLGGTLLFSAVGTPGNRELWRSDGTAAGTYQVADINPASTGSIQRMVATMDGVGYVYADDGVVGPEIWRSDGTYAGTQLLRDITPGSANSGSLGPVGVFNHQLLFGIDDGTHGGELWRSDGTTAGTFLVSDIYPGANSSNMSSLIPFNGAMYFAANEPTTGRELWRTDGSNAGTLLVRDLFPGAASSSPALFSTTPVASGRLVFTALGASGGAGLWSSDGTSAGTTEFMLLGSSGTPSPIGSDGTYGYFTRFLSTSSPVAANPIELLRSNGTSGGTGVVKTFVAEGSGFSSGVAYGGRFYFFASDGVSGTELWTTDGTSAGTHIVADIRPGPVGGGMATTPVVAAGLIWFVGNDGVHGRELWRSDGTAAGTFMVSDIYAGPLSSAPSIIGESGGYVYFSAYDASNGLQVWRSDGTSAGTSRFSDLANDIVSISGGVAVANGFVLALDDGVHGSEPWFLQTVFDTTPDAFSFTTMNDVLPGLYVVSNAITPAGYNTPAPISVTNGEYSIGCTSTFTSSAGTIAPGQSVCVRQVASVNLSSGVTTTLTIGGTSGTFTSITVAANPSGAIAGDVNGDGHSDMVFVDASGNVQVSFMDGSTAGYSATYTLPAGATLAGLGDFNGDGREDLILVMADGSVAVAGFNGTGFSAPVPIASIPPDAELAGIASFATGTTAALATGGAKAAKAAGSTSTVIVWRSRKGGRFIVWTVHNGALTTQSIDDHSGNGWATLGIGDVDGDGMPEGLVMNNAGFVRVVKLSGASPGAFTQLAPKSPGVLAGIGDINGDGRADLVWQGSDGKVTAWLMNASGIASQGVIGTLPAGALVLNVADLTGDGKSDLVVKLASGALQLWTLDGLSVTSVAPLPNPGAGFTLVKN